MVMHHYLSNNNNNNSQRKMNSNDSRETEIKVWHPSIQSGANHLKLHPKTCSEDYNRILNNLVDGSYGPQCFQHVNIFVPQENILQLNKGYGYDDDRSVNSEMIKLGVRSIRRFLSSGVCKSLETFVLIWESGITDFALEVTDGGRALAPLGNLATLKAIRIITPIFDSVDILSAMLNQNLMDLQLRFLLIGERNKPWSKQTRKDLIRCFAPLSKLVKLHLEDNHFHDEDLEELLSNKPNLRSLDLSGGWGDSSDNKYSITDLGFQTIAKLCPKLHHLALHSQLNATVDGLWDIFQGCPELRSLEIGFPLGSNFSSVLPLAKSLLYLRVKVGFSKDMPDYIHQAVVATGGRVVIVTDYHGILDLPKSTPSNIRQTYMKSREICDQVYNRQQKNPSIIDEWENVPLSIDIVENNALSRHYCHQCLNSDLNVEKKCCSRCKQVYYCGVKCQKKDWEFHKYMCIDTSTQKHKVTEFTIEAIQKAINHANVGDAIILSPGTYTSTSKNPELIIDKPLCVLAPSPVEPNQTELKSALVIKPSGSMHDKKHTLTLANITIGDGSRDLSSAMCQIENNSYKAINLYSVKVSCYPFLGGDAVKITGNSSKILFLKCDINGGKDGIHINGGEVLLKKTEISAAYSRGIFASTYFTIDDCSISGCGAYGIKGRVGWCEKNSNNRIQPGPCHSDGPSASRYF